MPKSHKVTKKNELFRRLYNYFRANELKNKASLILNLCLCVFVAKNPIVVAYYWLYRSFLTFLGTGCS